MSESPVVTVLMPVYNSAEFLNQAVQSILQQTFSDFEFLIINDGSTDGSAALLDAIKDTRLKVSRNDQNRGLTYSLKLGVEKANGKYIARMDADDIAVSNRLEQQVAFLEAHPNVGILGTACQLIDRHNRVVGDFYLPEQMLFIRWVSLLTNPFVHPTVMIRRSSLVENSLNYDEHFQTAQDYDLWTRLLYHTNGFNLKQPLLQYRVHTGSVTTRQRSVQLAHHDFIAFRTIKEQLPEFSITAEQVSQLRALVYGGDSPAAGSDAQRIPLLELYLSLLEAFLVRHAGEAGQSELNRQEIARVARVLLRPPFQPGWAVMLRRLLTLEPALPWLLFKRLPASIMYRLRRFALN